MHPRDLLEVATLVAAHAPQWLAVPHALPAEALEQYWSASKIRFDRWARELKPWTAAGGTALRPDALATMSEILSSEVLTRVWGAYLCLHDSRFQGDCGQPVARSVLTGHIEIRRRVLSLMLHASALSVEDAVELNRLRYRCERWIDLLISRLARCGDIYAWAVDESHSRRIAAACRPDFRRDDGAWQWMQASLGAAFSTLRAGSCGQNDLRGRIVDAVLASLPASAFEDAGVVRPAWLARLLVGSADTQVLIGEYLSIGRPAAASPPDTRAAGSAPRIRWRGDG